LILGQLGASVGAVALCTAYLGDPWIPIWLSWTLVAVPAASLLWWMTAVSALHRIKFRRNQRVLGEMGPRLAEWLDLRADETLTDIMAAQWRQAVATGLTQAEAQRWSDPRTQLHRGRRRVTGEGVASGGGGDRCGGPARRWRGRRPPVGHGRCTDHVSLARLVLLAVLVDPVQRPDRCVAELGTHPVARHRTRSRAGSGALLVLLRCRRRNVEGTGRFPLLLNSPDETRGDRSSPLNVRTPARSRPASRCFRWPGTRGDREGGAPTHWAAAVTAHGIGDTVAAMRHARSGVYIATYPPACV
jgi:hypothetical protein